MAKVIIMPRLDFAQEDGQMGEWYKKVGETVAKGEPFFDIYTGKSVVTVDSVDTGTLLKILVEPDETVPVFTPIAVVGDPGEDVEAALKAYAAENGGEPVAAETSVVEEPAPAAEPVGSNEELSSLKLTPKARKLVQDEGYDPESIRQVKGTGFQGGITYKDIKASPLARKIAEKNNVDLTGVSGTGTGGRIMKADVEAAMKKSSTPAADDKIVASRVPYSGVRQIIGQRLSQSKFTAPHLYFTDEVDTTNMTAFRKMLLEKGEAKVSVSDILIMAVSKALQKYPGINSSLIDNEIVTYESTNVGMAVAGSNGLVVPVVKNVQRKTIGAVAAETRDLVARAKEGRLAPSEYSGGTFSISNLGMFGIKNFTAIINPPESAILSISSVRKTPVVVTDPETQEDRLEIRPMMNIQLSVDHRVIDGLLAAQFVGYMKELLEEPIKILL